jgi:hypothetical protein
VSISHVTSFYGITNPFAWAIYLSVAIEIAALSALAGVSVNMGKFIYFPFILVTFIQFVGNLFFSYSYIQETSESFKQWMEMAGPLFENMGVDPTDMPTHKLMLALFSGGLLPVISLTFAHMLVVFSNKENTTETPTELTEEQIDELSRKAGIIEREINTVKSPVIWTPENLEKLAEHLEKIQKEKFGEEEKTEETIEEIHVEPTIEEIHVEHVKPTIEEIHVEHVKPTIEEIHVEHVEYTEEIVVEDQNLEEIHVEHVEYTEDIVVENQNLDETHEEHVEYTEEIVVEDQNLEEIHEEIVVENQNLDELKDQLSKDTNIKRLSYLKRDV